MVITEVFHNARTDAKKKVGHLCMRAPGPRKKVRVRKHGFGPPEAAKGIQIENFKVTDVRVLGPNTAREQGYMRAKTRGDNPQEMTGKYVVVWEKVDGKWKLDSDIWNLNK